MLIIEIRGQSVLLDSNVAELYGVETKRINETVKNNPTQKPAGNTGNTIHHRNFLKNQRAVKKH